MWKLCIDDDENNRTEVKLGRSEYALGRGETNTIRLTDRNISRNHARLAEGPDGRWTLFDLDSDNGSFVNGTRVVGSGLLKHSDFIQLGDYRLRITDDEVARTHPELDEDTLRALPRGPGNDQVDRLIVVEGASAGSEYSLGPGSTLIGRGEECQIPLTDTSVSRVHAEIVGTESGYELFDRGSANGLRVNGVELSRTFLQPGDIVELGDILVKFVPRGEVLLNTSPDGQSYPSVSISPDAQTRAGSAGRAVIWTSLSALLLLVLVFAVMQDPGAPASSAPVAQRPVSRAAVVLKEATELHRQGNVSQAHEKLREIPADSNLRQAPDLMEIERSWADTIFEMMTTEGDLAIKNALLSEVIGTQGVNSAQRQRAFAELEALQEPGVKVSDLPVDDHVEQPTPQAAKAPARGEASAASKAGAGKPAARTPGPPQEPAPARTAPPAPSPNPPPTESDGLIRKSPF